MVYLNVGLSTEPIQHSIAIKWVPRIWYNNFVTPSDKSGSFPGADGYFYGLSGEKVAVRELVEVYRYL